MSNNRWIISIGSNSENLKSAEYDAIDIFKLFSWNWDCDSEHKVLLTGNYATTENTNIAINKLLTHHAEKDDYIIIFLSGHVFYEYNHAVTGFFVTSDFSKEFHKLGINLRSLRYLVEESSAKYIIVIIDGCASGIINQREENHKIAHWFYFTTGETSKEINTKLFITAVSSGRNTYERKNKENSDFTELIISVIKQSLIRKEGLTNSIFYDKIAKKAKELNLPDPVKSGVEVGYSQLIINKNINELDLYYQNKDISTHIPSWLKLALDDNKRNYNLNDDQCVFVKDNNYPDGTTLSIGQNIIKSWRVKNAGKVLWRNRFLKRIGKDYRGVGLVRSNMLIPINTVEPGEEIDINVELTMPDYEGSVYFEFKMVDASGNSLFPNRKGLYCHFNVIKPE